MPMIYSSENLAALHVVRPLLGRTLLKNGGIFPRQVTLLLGPQPQNNTHRLWTHSLYPAIPYAHE